MEGDEYLDEDDLFDARPPPNAFGFEVGQQTQYASTTHALTIQCAAAGLHGFAHSRPRHALAPGQPAEAQVLM